MVDFEGTKSVRLRDCDADDLESMIFAARLRAQEERRPFIAYLLDLALAQLADENDKD